ncbi:hypothetical protein DAI22_02g326300 [Oryza sativa Japonica Group]|nr:hypothetical protein DAI22_02g326300 [Oryza sativa Japonica Group]
MALVKRFVLPLMMAVLLVLVVSGSARQLGGDKRVGVATSGDHLSYSSSNICTCSS